MIPLLILGGLFGTQLAEGAKAAASKAGHVAEGAKQVAKGAASAVAELAAARAEAERWRQTATAAGIVALAVWLAKK